MEFSFGIAIAALLSFGVFSGAKYLLRGVIKVPAIMWTAAVICAGVTVLFPAGGIVLALFLFLPLWIARIGIFKKFDGFVYQVPFLAALMIFALYYIPYTGAIWYEAEQWVTVVLDGAGLLEGYAFIDVYGVLRFFRSVYPALLVFLLFLAYYSGIEGGKYKNSLWYRYFRNFDHLQIFPMMAVFVLLGAGYALTFWTGEITPLMSDIGFWMLNAALFFAMPYVMYGILIILFGLRKKGLSLMFGMIGLFFLFLISGPVFVFTLIFLMGIGISDIWMGYNTRHSVKKKENERRLP
ncbi:MAG: hypothetical protein A2Y33_04755 [Spirochaetes bacterium GWF1_51_8]|nr:MAG: hypothetical protein A2Y33_04755 [Spirochaetes bacterium GWF1_51_8]